MAANFFGFSIHLEVRCIVVVSEELNWIGRESFIAENEEKSVFF